MHQIVYSEMRCLSLLWNIRYRAFSAYCRHLEQGLHCSDPIYHLIMN